MIVVLFLSALDYFPVLRFSRPLLSFPPITEAGTPDALHPGVIVAIPSWQQRVSPVLDTAMNLLVVTCRNGKEHSRRTLELNPMSPVAFAHCIAEMHVDVLLCGALSLELQHALEKQRVWVWPHLCGKVDEILQAFDCGTLDRAEFHMPGCHCDHCYPPSCNAPRRRRLRRCRRAKASRQSTPLPIL